MAYRLKRGDRVSKAAPRIARKEAGKARQALHRRGRSERVHDARTSVKKLRGLLRLVQPPKSVYEREDRRLHRLGRELSELRDAEVLVTTFDRLFEHFELQLGAPLRQVRARLTRRLRRVESTLDLPSRLRHADRAFDKLRRRARRWKPPSPLRSHDWKALADGLGATYQWGRDALAAAYDKPSDTAFHDWRKAVKYHGHHMRLLVCIWPEEMERRLELLEALGDRLGEDHDLSVFAETLRNEPGCFRDEREQEVLLGLVAQKKAELRAQARPLGARLFAEPPRAFCRRLHGYWRAWRRLEPARSAA